METGIKGKQTFVVEQAQSAKEMGSGTLNVLATPAMVAWMEQTAWRSVADQLDEGQGTVGILMNIKHLAPTPLGMTVTCEAELTRVEGRKLCFTVHAEDETGVIGEGTHERFIIDETAFQSKADSKKK